MPKVLFINGSAHGHINPTLPLVKELADRGEEVFYFTTDQFKEKVTAAGAVFVDAGERLTAFNKNYRPSGSHPFYVLIDYILGTDQVIAPLVLGKAREIGVDYIIHDSLFGAGNIVGRKLDIPAICSCTSFAMGRLPMPPHMLEPGFHPELDALYEKIRLAAQEWGVSGLSIMDIFFKKSGLNIVFTSKEFQPDAGSFDGSFKFVGASIAERHETVDFPVKGLEGKTVVYVSMGTINNNVSEFYKKCMDAFAGTDLKVVLSIGQKTDMAALGRVPDNFIVERYVPQLDVLKKTGVFISHGGLNSVNEAMYFGVPVIAVPQGNDQFMVSRQLSAVGAGLSLKMEEVTPQMLKESVDKILQDASYKAASRKIGESFRKAGGYKAAADYILGYRETGKSDSGHL